MAIELGLRIDLSRFGKWSIKETLPPPAKPANPDVLSGHEKLFDSYQIPLDTIIPTPNSKVTTLPTRDGDLLIDWEKKAIVAPLIHYLNGNSQKSS